MYVVLCPNTPFFLLTLVTYMLGMIKFNVMHEDDIWLVKLGPGFLCAIIFAQVDWRHIFASLQIFAPMMIWSASIALPIFHWLFR